MHLFQQPVGDIQPQSALRIRFQNVTEFPANGIWRNTLLQPANQPARKYTLHQPAKNAAHADVHFEHPQNVAAVFLTDFKRDVVDANHFAALCVDNLLVEQIADQAQHVLVGVVRGQVLVAQVNAVERNRCTWS